MPPQLQQNIVGLKCCVGSKVGPPVTVAVLFPEQTISADDLPERYRNRGAAAWIGSGVSVAASLAPSLAATAAQACATDTAAVAASDGRTLTPLPIQAAAPWLR